MALAALCIASRDKKTNNLVELVDDRPIRLIHTLSLRNKYYHRQYQSLRAVMPNAEYLSQEKSSAVAERPRDAS